MKTKNKPLRNNKIEPGKDYDFLTLAAEKIVKQSIAGMMRKLAGLKNVEYFYDEDEDTKTACVLNSDTAFREQLYDAVENEVVSNLYRNTN